MGDTRTLTVQLLRSWCEGPEHALRDIGALEEVQLRMPAPFEAYLFTKRPKPQPPPWEDFFADFVDDGVFGEGSSPRAVLLLRVQERWFALPFGQGRYFLNPQAIEYGFGLRVTVNAIREDQLRSIDKETFDTLADKSRRQSPIGTSAQNFGLDLDKDLLVALTGIPSDKTIGARLAGMDALRVVTTTKLEELESWLGRILVEYAKNDYQRKFPWVDRINEVRDEQLTEELTTLLMVELNQRFVTNQETKSLTSTWLTPPTLLDWERADRFTYAKGRTAQTHFDLHWEEYLRERGGQITADRASRERIVCFDGDGREFDSWPLFRCIYAELDVGGENYVLSAGRWFRVERSFVSEVNDFFESIDRWEITLPDYDDATEGHFNRRVARALGLRLFDFDLVRHGGGKVEFCDLVSESGDLIHVKRYSGSATLSHLFAQAMVAGELFKVDASFREKVYPRLPLRFTTGGPRAPIEPACYRIVFAVVSQSSGPLKLPFFARVSLRSAVNRLAAFGYRVAVSKVGVAAEKRILKIIPPRRPPRRTKREGS